MQAYIDQLIQDGAFAGMPKELFMRSRWCSSPSSCFPFSSRRSPV